MKTVKNKICPLLILMLLISSFSFGKDKMIKIVVPVFGDDGSITEDVYYREYPKTIEESREIIDTILDIYNVAANAYTDLVKETDMILEDVRKEIIEIGEENTILRKLFEDINEIDEIIEERKKPQNKFNLAFGLMANFAAKPGEYDFGLQASIRFWKMMFGIGPIVSMPRIAGETVTVGVISSLGIWF
ncbi:MAG: hypothetical protein ACRC5M_05000 [Anaeroplasmataceae bacterium]